MTMQIETSGTGTDTTAPARPSGPRPHVNEYVRQWVETCVALCQPDRVVWCDGSPEE